MSVATMPTLTPEQLAAITAQAIATHKAERKAKKEAKPSKLAADVQQISKLEQSTASERDKLVEDGHKLCGIGLTNNRVKWAERLISYARLNSDSNNGMFKVIDQIQLSIINRGDGVSSDTTGKTGKIRTINESLQLAVLGTFVPQVKLLDWGCALLFIRFLEKFNLVKPEVSHVDEAKKIASAVALRKPEYLNKNGYIDRKNVKLMIDSIIGTSRASKASPMEAMKAKIEQLEADLAEAEDGVTSIHAVSDWLQQASNDDLIKLVASLGAQRATDVLDVMTSNMPV